MTSEMTLEEARVLLGVLPTASYDEIHHKYKLLSKAHHPDAPGGDAAMFTRITLARDLLTGAVDVGPKSHLFEEEFSWADVEPVVPRDAMGERDGRTAAQGAPEKGRGTCGAKSGLLLVAGGVTFLGKIAVFAVVGVGLLTWQILKGVGALLRFVALAGSWPCSLGGVAGLLIFGLVCSWVIGHFFEGRWVLLEWIPLVLSAVRIVGTPWRAR